VVICLEQGADLHTAQLMPLSLTVSCFSKIQIGFTFLVLDHPGSPRQRAVKGCMYVCNLKFIVRSTYDSHLRRAKNSLRNIVSQFTNTISGDLTILQVNCT